MRYLYHARSGLSLIELSVGIGIFILLGFIALPYLQSSNLHTKLNGDAEALASDLRLAGQRTVGEQVTYLIKLFNNAPQKYQLIKRQDGVDTLIEERPLSSGISWQNLGDFTNNEIIFTTTSAALEEGTITLVSTDNRTTSVEIKPSGYVRTY